MVVVKTNKISFGVKRAYNSAATRCISSQNQRLSTTWLDVKVTCFEQPKALNVGLLTQKCSCCRKQRFIKITDSVRLFLHSETEVTFGRFPHTPTESAYLTARTQNKKRSMMIKTVRRPGA